MTNLEKKPTQTAKILKALEDANGSWVNGRFFLHTLYISQFHARIFELQRQGYVIEAGKEKDEYGFVSYRLVEKSPEQKSFFMESEKGLVL